MAPKKMAIWSAKIKLAPVAVVQMIRQASIESVKILSAFLKLPLPINLEMESCVPVANKPLTIATIP